jgi:DNA modification methylase
MNSQYASFVFKLRQNIVLEGDLVLAKMELDAFLSDASQDIADIAAVAQRIPQLAKLHKFGALDSYVRQNGTQAYVASGPLALLPDLIRCVSFVQRIYCVTRDTEEARRLLIKIETALGPVIVYHADGDFLVVQAVPHYALFEFSDVVARHSGSAAETKLNLDATLNALLGKTDDRHAGELAKVALSARSTTSHLSHDIHYYKAKFFPRLARSMLNVCMQRLGEQPHRVIDNFVGSGTTLLEAASLGIPSVGLDIDPLSVLIARAKLEVVRLDSDLLAREVGRTLQLLEARAKGQLILFERSSSGEIGTPAFPAWLMKNRKMTPEIAIELGEEIDAVRIAVAACRPQVRPLFRVLMSDAISRKIRMRFLGTGVGRFSLTFARTPIARIFSKSLQKYAKVAATYEWLRHTIHLDFADTQVAKADARHIPDDLGRFDILVTSPPYLPASSGRESYAKARAPSLIALGMRRHDEVDDLVDKSIGSMYGDGIDSEMLTECERNLVEWLRRDELRAIKAEPTARYFLDMRKAFTEMYRVLIPGALAVVVSGKQSTFYNFSTRETLYIVRSAELLAEEARGVGFEVEAMHDVQLNKSNMNARPRSLDDYYETLIVLRRPLSGRPHLDH